MKNKTNSIILITILTSILITSCGNAEEPAPTIDPVEVMTQVAGTVQAEVTQAAMLVPTATMPAPIPTAPLPIPTSALPVPTAPSVLPTAPSTGIPQQSPDDAIWVADIESPDGTIFEPDERFTRVMRIENTGTTTWNTEYSLVYWDGQPIMCDETDNIQYLQQSVDPGMQIDFSIRCTAPTAYGNYSNYYKLINDEGQPFGPDFYIIMETGTWEAKKTQQHAGDED